MTAPPGSKTMTFDSKAALFARARIASERFKVGSDLHLLEMLLLELDTERRTRETESQTNIDEWVHTEAAKHVASAREDNAFMWGYLSGGVFVALVTYILHGVGVL